MGKIHWGSLFIGIAVAFLISYLMSSRKKAAA